jgi:hypothetical protein
MSLEQASYLSQVIAALAVVASLVFVGFQIRQNTRSQRVVAVNSLAAAAVSINVPGMESASFGEALSKALASWTAASREQRMVAHYFLFSFFKISESAWYQHQVQVLDAAQWAGWENLLLAIYHTDGVQSGWWPHRGNVYSPEFQEYLARSSKKQVSAGTLDDIFSNKRPRGSDLS